MKPDIYATTVKWTPVSEALPITDGRYLVTHSWIDGERDIGIREFKSGMFRTNFSSVLAWAPLPEPWNGE